MIQKFQFDISDKDRSSLISLIKNSNQFINDSFGTTELTNIQILKEYNNVLNRLKQVFNQYTNDCFDIISNENYKLDFHLTKSWGTFTKDFMHDEIPHHHGYANFAFVFYLTKPDNSNIVFKDLNNVKFEIEANENEIIVYPGYYNHFIKNKSHEERLSVAGDIVMTLQPNQPSWEFLTPINMWIQL